MHGENLKLMYNNVW